LMSEDRETGDVVGVVLDVLGENIEAEFTCGFETGDGGDTWVFFGKLGGGNGTAGFHQTNTRKMIRQPTSTLRERLWLAVNLSDFVSIGNRHQVVVDGKTDFTDDRHVGLDQSAQRVDDSTVGAVFDRNNPSHVDISTHRLKHRRYGGHRIGWNRITKVLQSGEMAVAEKRA